VTLKATPKARRLLATILSVLAGVMVVGAVGLLGYPIPDQFDDEGLGLATSLNSGRVSSLREDAIEVTLPIVPGESGEAYPFGQSTMLTDWVQNKYFNWPHNAADVTSVRTETFSP